MPLPKTAERLRDRIVAELLLIDESELDTLYELGCELYGDSDATVQQVGVEAERYWDEIASRIEK